MEIPPTKYCIPDEDLDRVLSEYRELIESGRFLSYYEKMEALETAFADHHGVQHALATNSGTSALEAILRALNVEGGEVVVPTNTFAATAFAVVHAGATPVFADIGQDLCVDPQSVAQKITHDTKAVITVHIGGLVSPGIDRLAEICKDRDVPIVEDAAHAHGSSYEGRKAGSFGVAGAFSFFSTKVMTTGEGGMVTTDDDRIADIVGELRDQAKIDFQNRHERIGHNWRMPEFQAILGLTQVERLDEFLARRQEIAGIYRQELADESGLEWREVPDESESNFYKCIGFVEEGRAEDLGTRLREEFGVKLGGAVYDLPLHRQPVFKHLADESFPVADDLCGRHICPPVYPQMTDEEAHWVVNSLRKCLS